MATSYIRAEKLRQDAKMSDSRRSIHRVDCSANTSVEACRLGILECAKLAGYEVCREAAKDV